MPRCFSALHLVLLTVGAAPGEPIAPPRTLADGLSVELVASEPAIVTPVGMAFDKQGRLLVVESHTHQRKEGYQGPRHDRIRMLADTNGDGLLSSEKGDTWSTFAEGYRHAMNLVVHPNSGDLYLVCRNAVHRLRDTDNDGRADQDDVIVRLETDVDYPHNGLGGIALCGDEALSLGLGENFGAPYRLVGTDGSELRGRGGVGIIFACTLQGKELESIARGFWNPFGLCSPSPLAMFCVDNDPDASPPCRLINALPAGDYGHRYEYGRAGIHPLQAWDGELPGTLGMMAGTGEAPCAVVFHQGSLWVTSWGEHRIERYELTLQDYALKAERDVAVQGDADFRPTGMAVAPDGSLYFGDWVSRSYPVHGAGRVWRMTGLASGNGLAVQEEQMALLRSQVSKEINATSEEQKRQLLARHLDESPLRRQLLIAGQRSDISPVDVDGAVARNLGVRVPSVVWLSWLRHAGEEVARKVLPKALVDPDPDTRLYAVRWIADEHLTEFKDDVAKLLEGEIPNERYYLAVLAAVDWLGGERKMRHSGIADGLLARELRNKRRPPAIKALALRLISPDHKQLTLDNLRAFLASDYPPLRSEAVRTLALQANPARVPLLLDIAGGDSWEDEPRADAVMGLAGEATSQKRFLTRLAGNAPPKTRAEARRVLRLAQLTPRPAEDRPRAEELDDWMELIAQKAGDAESGRRLFHSALGARCGACHRHSGRGGRIGPELTHIGAKLSRRRLVESILQPSREIAPRYQAWVLETDEGKTLTGLRLHKAGDNGIERYANPEGRTFEIRSEQIDARTPSKTSIMPSGLERLVSVQDLRDLIAFLAAKSNLSVPPPK